MALETYERKSEPWFRRLFLPAYQLSDAARYSGAHPNTVASWCRGTSPVVEFRKHRTPLSYMQLVEVAFVAFFRRIGVPMPRIRSAKEYIAQTFRAEYPFVQLEFKTEGFHVLMDYQQFYPAQDFNKVIVADSNGQLAWTDLLGEKFAEFDYENELALRWHPAGRNSPVVLDPRVAFGAPTVQGLPTWTLKGRYLAGEGVDEIVNDFDLPRELVIEGLRFEGVRIEEFV